MALLLRDEEVLDHRGPGLVHDLILEEGESVGLNQPQGAQLPARLLDQYSDLYVVTAAPWNHAEGIVGATSQLSGHACHFHGLVGQVGLSDGADDALILHF